MCLGIPMEILEIDGFDAHCSAKGVTRDVSLFLLQDEPLAIGDFVMVHVCCNEWNATHRRGHDMQLQSTRAGSDSQ